MTAIYETNDSRMPIQDATIFLAIFSQQRLQTRSARRYTISQTSREGEHSNDDSTHPVLSDTISVQPLGGGFPGTLKLVKPTFFSDLAGRLVIAIGGSTSIISILFCATCAISLSPGGPD